MKTFLGCFNLYKHIFIYTCKATIQYNYEVIHIIYVCMYITIVVQIPSVR